MIRAVHIVCGNSIARQGLGALIAAQGFTLGESVGSVAELIRNPPQQGVAIIAELGAASQAAAIAELAAACPSIHPVVLSTSFDFDVMVACFREGADGYLLGDMSVDALVAALQMVSSDQKVFPSNLADELSRERSNGSHTPRFRDDVPLDELERLSQREREVLCCLMSGSSNKVIAQQLKVSEATIKVNVKGILRKLNVSNRTQAALWARQQGALDTL
jgi:two-component system nitrate/nitrite response regulator NarL